MFVEADLLLSYLRLALDHHAVFAVRHDSDTSKEVQFPHVNERLSQRLSPLYQESIFYILLGWLRIGGRPLVKEEKGPLAYSPLARRYISHTFPFKLLRHITSFMCRKYPTLMFSSNGRNLIDNSDYLNLISRVSR